MFNLLKEKIQRFIGRAEENASEEKTVKLSAATQIKGLLKSSVTLTDNDVSDALSDLEMDLIGNDVAMEAAGAIINELRKKIVGREVDKGSLDQFIKDSLKQTIIEVLTPEKEVDLLDQIKNSPKPYKIVFFGVNGTGKTTTIAKVARHLMDNGLSVVLAAGDTFRAGAIEQIETHAEALGVRVIRHQKSGDSAAVIFDAIEHAKARNIDVVLADTAGRMQTNVNLMDEMKKIIRVNKPDMRIFVGDSLTGNDAIEQAERFHKEIGIDAVILTKMDADSKGGSALSISYITKRPIIFIGMGQKYGDLKRFDSVWFAEQITG